MATKNVDLKNIELESLGKLLFNLFSGKGGITPVISFLDQNPYPEIQELKTKMKKGFLYYDTMLQINATLKNKGNGEKATKEQVTKAFDELGIAYVSAYNGLAYVLSKTLEKDKCLFTELQKASTERFIFGLYPGDCRIANEEREILQLLAEGTLSEFSTEKASSVIVKAIDVLKYGFLCNQNQLNEYDNYEKAVNAYTKAFDEALKQIR